jgi:hypothetical protein
VVRPLISPYETGTKDHSVSMLARLLDGCGIELRMQAADLNDADRDLYRDVRLAHADDARAAYPPCSEFERDLS